MKIAVIGAGVNGLTCALTLLEQNNHSVTVIAEKFSPNTTSDIAAAIWYPYHVAPEKKAAAWAKVSLQQFDKLQNDSSTGVQWLPFTLMSNSPDDILDEPTWLSFVERLEIPEQFQKDNIYARTTKIPFIDTPLYLSYLLQQVKSLGVTLQEKKIASFKDVSPDYDVLINCTGLASRVLCQDERLTPGRGQVTVVERPKGVDEGFVFMQGDIFSHVLPRVNTCVIGGTDVEGDWNKTVDEQEAKAELERILPWCPELANAKIITTHVGLRPCRDVVRLEREQLDDDTVIIHNYGHGGAGITLSWGCAAEVSALIP